MTPACFDCLSEDVAVKLIDQHRFEHYFCARDWAANVEFHENLLSMLWDAADRLGALAP